MIRGLVGIAFLPGFHGQVLSNIWAGRGLPNLWLGTYQAQAVAQTQRAERAEWTNRLILSYGDLRVSSGAQVNNTINQGLAGGMSTGAIEAGLANAMAIALQAQPGYQGPTVTTPGQSLLDFLEEEIIMEISLENLFRGPIIFFVCPGEDSYVCNPNGQHEVALG